MADYERSATISAPPGAAFAFLSEAANLPKYVALMTGASPTGPGALHVAAEVQGRHEEGEATFTADPGARTIRWGRNGSDYRGWLRVAGAGAGSTVTIHLQTRGDGDALDIERAIEDSLANIKRAAAGM